MRFGTIVWLLAAVGCDRVWQLDVVHDGAPSEAADADLDADDDGVLDDGDNCRDIANGYQDDEDADGIGDACDTCPITSLTTDTDADGVGDLCDPNPMTAGDRLALFEGFERGVPETFTTSDSWMAGDGDVWVATPVGVRASLYVPAPSARETVTALVRMTSTVGTDYRVAGIKDNAAIGTNTSTICSILVAGTTDPDPSFQDKPMIDMYRLPGGAVLDRKVYAWQLNEDVVLTMTRSDNNYTCRASNSAGTATVSGTNPADVAMPQVALHVEDATVHYAWLMIVSSP